MNFRVLLLTTCGLGLLRPAPGTWSSFPVAILAAAAGSLGAGMTAMAIGLVVLCIAASWVCIAFGEFAEQQWGKKDPGRVTADEVAGQAIALIALPWRTTGESDWIVWNGALALAAFFSFRFFDITKLPPAAQTQKLHAGWGILIDDLIAGVYALAATQAFAHFVMPNIL